MRKMIQDTERTGDHGSAHRPSSVQQDVTPLEKASAFNSTVSSSFLYELSLGLSRLTPRMCRPIWYLLQIRLQTLLTTLQPRKGTREVYTAEALVPTHTV